MELSTVDEVVNEINGLTITGGDINDQGMHLNLSDGRILMFVGEFILCVGVVEESKLQ